MEKIVEIEYLDIEKNTNYEKIIKKVLKECFKIEQITNRNYYVSIILTNNENIKEINTKYRNINKETDVLSFPMFEKEDINKKDDDIEEVLGDIVISTEKVQAQSEEYGHSFERELSYMVVHGFYHIMGYDHIKESDQKIMREKEEAVLSNLKISR